MKKLIRLTASSELAYFIALSGVIAQVYHIYNMVLDLNDLGTWDRHIQAAILGWFFSMGLFYFVIRIGTSKGEAERRRYKGIINWLVFFELLVNLYFWSNRVIFIVLFSNGLEQPQWNLVEWNKLFPLLLFSIAIPLLIKSYAGEINVEDIGKKGETRRIKILGKDGERTIKFLD